jgi:hypothetical protein
MAQVRDEAVAQPVEIQDPAPTIDVCYASRLKVAPEHIGGLVGQFGVSPAKGPRLGQSAA